MSDRYYETLPRKRMSAGGIILNPNNEVILVKPSYKNLWLLPGDVIEQLESPLDAIKRELREEISLDIDPIKLMFISYIKGKTKYEEALCFIFNFGTINNTMVKKIKIYNNEIIDFKFFKLNEIDNIVSENTKKAIHIAYNDFNKNGTYYVENGIVVF